MQHVHLFINLFALNVNTPVFVKFFDEDIEKQAKKFEKQADAGQPLYLLKQSQLYQPLEYYRGFAEAKVGELLGDDLDYTTRIELDQLTGQNVIVILPPGVAGYKVSVNDGAETIDYTFTTFERAMNAAYGKSLMPYVYEASITPLDEKGEQLGDPLDYYYSKKKHKTLKETLTA